MAVESPSARVTYSAMAIQDEALHRQYEQALERVRAILGQTYPNYVAGQACSSPDGTFDDPSPIDRRIIVGRFQRGMREDVHGAVAAARRAFLEWGRTPYQERVACVRRVIRAVEAARFDLAAMIAYDVGKSRAEALGEVDEVPELLGVYCDQLEEAHGYVRTMRKISAGEYARDVLRPYGVFSIIGPFNFPLALSAGMAIGALLGGNTVVIKPPSDAPLAMNWFCEALGAAGVPPGAVNCVTGGGSVVGDELIHHPGVDGSAFTGSAQVGMAIYRVMTSGIPRPCITEMGGKNPVLVMPTADLEKAAQGVLRSAFGVSNQRCSATSRVYVHQAVYPAFLDILVEKVRNLKVGNPLERDTFMGPVINVKAVRDFERYVEGGRRDGRIVIGGHALTQGDLAYGNYVEPTIIDRLPLDHPYFEEEMFLPILCIGEVESFNLALQFANRTQYGLTAGIFSQDRDEIEVFFDRIQAGVVYANRAAGATTGGWPGVQSFTGWKLSGTTGKGALGPYYVQQFMKEQAQTIVE